MREFTTELFMSPQWYVARTFFEGQNEPPSTAHNFVSARSNVPRPSYMRPTRWGMQASAMHRGLRMVSWLISGGGAARAAWTVTIAATGPAELDEPGPCDFAFQRRAHSITRRFCLALRTALPERDRRSTCTSVTIRSCRC
jgi:hypothetical protein